MKTPLIKGLEGTRKAQFCFLLFPLFREHIVCPFQKMKPLYRIAEKVDFPQTPILLAPSSHWTSPNCEKYVSLVYKTLPHATPLYSQMDEDSSDTEVDSLKSLPLASCYPTRLFI